PRRGGACALAVGHCREQIAMARVPLELAGGDDLLSSQHVVAGARHGAGDDCASNLPWTLLGCDRPDPARDGLAWREGRCPSADAICLDRPWRRDCCHCDGMGAREPIYRLALAVLRAHSIAVAS